MSIHEVKPYVVGVDIGGTNTVFGIVNMKGVVVACSIIRTRDYPDVNDYIDTLCNQILLLIQTTCSVEEIRGIGIGAPNGNYYHGTIEHAPNLIWKGIIPLAKLFQERLGIPTVVTNDANAAAVGEMTYGVARGMKNFIMLTLGTGVGSGIIVNGQLVYGHDGFAGELGHVIVRREGGRLCGCGRHGCLEAYCSATGVARTAREMLEEDHVPSLLRNLPTESLTSKEVYEAALQGDALAKRVFDFTGRLLGESIADFIAVTSPEAVILFGGLSKAGALLIDPLQQAMDENILNIFKGKTKILVSSLKDADAAILGASALAWELGS